MRTKEEWEDMFFILWGDFGALLISVQWMLRGVPV